MVVGLVHHLQQKSVHNFGAAAGAHVHSILVAGAVVIVAAIAIVIIVIII